MNWKSNLQLRDLSLDQRLEMTCKRCGHVHYLTRAGLASLDHNIRLDVIERDAVCRARGCGGKVRMAIIWPGDASAFIGGLA